MPRPIGEVYWAAVDAAAYMLVARSLNRVRSAMNNFVICCGTYVAPLGSKAIAVARRLGKVEVDLGDTDCQVPEAESYIIKSRRGAAIAPKRKSVRC